MQAETDGYYVWRWEGSTERSKLCWFREREAAAKFVEECRKRKIPVQVQACVTTMTDMPNRQMVLSPEDRERFNSLINAFNERT